MPAPTEAIRRFAIWNVDLPHQAGHSQTGWRPAVIVADEPEHRFSIVCPITGNLQRLRFKCTLQVHPTAENGLHKPSVVLGFQVRYLDRNRLRQPLAQLGPEDRESLDGLLAELLGFDA